MDQEFDGKQTSVNVVPQFHFIIDPPSPVHSEDTKRMNEVRSGKCKNYMKVVKILTLQFVLVFSCVYF